MGQQLFVRLRFCFYALSTGEKLYKKYVRICRVVPYTFVTYSIELESMPLTIRLQWVIASIVFVLYLYGIQKQIRIAIQNAEAAAYNSACLCQETG